MAASKVWLVFELKADSPAMLLLEDVTVISNSVVKLMVELTLGVAAEAPGLAVTLACGSVVRFRLDSAVSVIVEADIRSLDEEGSAEELESGLRTICCPQTGSLGDIVGLGSFNPGGSTLESAPLSRY